MNRDRYYLEIAYAVALKSTCLRKQYGAVIVKNNEIIATGYNGAPRGEEHCKVCSKCDHGKDMETYLSCRSVHAEMNAIISAARKDMIGSTLYLVCRNIDVCQPCEICRRLIKNAGIKQVITEQGVIINNE